MNRTEVVAEAAVLAERVGHAVVELSDTLDLPGEVKDAVADVDRWVRAALDRRWGLDPYLVAAVSAATSNAWQHMIFDGDNGDSLMVALEQLRQGLIYLAEEDATAPDRPLSELADWLLHTGMDRETLADLLGVSTRTLQRWASGATPRTPEAARLQILARVVDNLRHAMTGAGAAMWLTHPHPALQNEPPAALLDRPDAYQQLAALAASTRSTTAA